VNSLEIKLVASLCIVESVQLPIKFGINRKMFSFDAAVVCASSTALPLSRTADALAMIVQK